jgi:catechol 2,3-dioxygenase-like lactoylglutathione lyase family enzyme
MNVQTISPRTTLAELPQRLHHYAFVVKDQEANRRFFEDVLGLPLVATWCERTYNAALKRGVDYCHTFYGIGDGGALAFFQYDNEESYAAMKPTNPETGTHIALKASRVTYDEIVERLKAAGLSYRETDHGYCQSLYILSPDGLRVEFTVDPPNVAEIDAMRRGDSHVELARWLAGDRRTNNHQRPH